MVTIGIIAGSMWVEKPFRVSATVQPRHDDAAMSVAYLAVAPYWPNDTAEQVGREIREAHAHGAGVNVASGPHSEAA